MNAPRLETPLRATYRLQFRAEFGLEQATRIVPYLADLGISHVYASPLTMARPGSSHGYDVIDFNRINPELGDEADFERFVETLHAHGMGLILDFVPNHMGVGSDSPWWLDVLEWGRNSPFAGFFDIDWEASARGVEGKVLLPTLGDQYGRVLEAGEISLIFQAATGSFFVAYYENRFPIGIQDYPRLLRTAADFAQEQAATLLDFAARFEALSAESGEEIDWRYRRQRAIDLKAQLAQLAEDGSSRDAIQASAAAFNGTPGQPESFRHLHQILERQAYRLAFWRVASSDINYRRFFDINDLAGLRMEQGEVFEATHRLLLRLVADGKIQGIRLDHIDGMYDPAGYCRRLLARISDVLQERGVEGAGAFDPKHAKPIYLLVEKILARHERLREDLPAAGTTGYDFMNEVLGLFINPEAEAPLTRTYGRLAHSRETFSSMLLAAKRQILRRSLDSELHVIAHEALRLAQQSWLTRDFTLTGLREALTDIIVRFPVYRTYITYSSVTDEDRRFLDWAVSQARKETGIIDQTVFDFLRQALSTDLAGTRDYARQDVVALAMHFQQLTGPVMAKSMEDTAFYRYHRLIALNEVGGEPDHFGVTPSGFHHAMQRQQRYDPLTMLSTATHDHKRGEDVRARLAVLSELPDDWAERVERWFTLNAFRHEDRDGRVVPSRNDEYLLYQTLIGACPLDAMEPEDLIGSELPDRVVAYMIKAMREAKLETSWLATDGEYEAGVERFVRTVLDPERGRPFLADLLPFQRIIARAGAVTGLAQTVIKLTAPGIPDTYQGSELWDLSLVDPDNRRPVDYEVRARNLDDFANADPGTLLTTWRDGRVKQFCVHRILNLRREAPELFTEGAYQALSIEGPAAEHAVVFARILNEHVVIVVAPRQLAAMIEEEGPLRVPSQPFRGTRVGLPEGWETSPFREILSGRQVAGEGGGFDLGDLFETFPVAVLIPEAPGA